MPIYNLPTVHPWVRQTGESVDYITAYKAIGDMLEAYGSAYGLRKVHRLQPELLTGEWPESVRWTVNISLRSQGWQNPPTAPGHPGGMRYHVHTLKEFVVFGPRTARHEDMQEQAAWVPRAYDEAFALNRTLASQVRLVTLLGEPQWVNQVYGRLKGQPLWHVGWLFTVRLVLAYIMEAK